MPESKNNNSEEVVHGALNFRELEKLGLAASEIIDFSVNSNPYGPSPKSREALVNLRIEQYPDRECLALKRAILEHDVPSRGLQLTNLVCGNGTSELIWAIARVWLTRGLKAGLLGPTFGEYRQATLATGASIVEYRTKPEDEFRLDRVAFHRWLTEERPDLLWLCNPNNPTGIWLEKPELLEIAWICQNQGIKLVVDEAYHRFIDSHPIFSALDWVNEQKSPEVIILRSLTKDYALAGLRLGYIAARPDLVVRIAKQLPAWNVNGAAQAVGVAALTDQSHLKKTLALLEIERQEFYKDLVSTGLPTVSSNTHYCLVKTGNADKVRQQLLQRKLLVRSGTSFGLSDYIRVATRPAPDRQQLVYALLAGNL